jgi:tRNA G18 (ribose-2'-O)-methylase SpoU
VPGSSPGRPTNRASGERLVTSGKCSIVVVRRGATSTSGTVAWTTITVLYRRCALIQVRTRRIRVLREAGGVSDAPKDPLVVTRGPIVGVDDPDDPRLDLFRDLNDPAGRIRLDSDQSVFVVEGRLAVDRLLTSEYTVRSLLVDDHQVTAASDLVAATRARGAPVFVGSRALVASTVGFALHRGVVAVANRPSPAGVGRLLADAAGTSAREGAPPLVAVLEGLNDHENIGALFRNAAAFGVAGVLLNPTCADPLYRRSIRVSVGHVLRIPFARLVPWPTGLHQVRSAGFVVAALAPRPAADSGVPAVSLAELKAWMFGSGDPVGVALLLGAEGPGLTDTALAASDVVVTIPMSDGVDSLNVATAAAVAFHALAGL